MITALSLLLAGGGLASDKLSPFTLISMSSLAQLDLTEEWSSISCPSFKLFVPCVSLPVFVIRILDMCKGLDDFLGSSLDAFVTACITVKTGSGDLSFMVIIGTLPFYEVEHVELLGKRIE